MPMRHLRLPIVSESSANAILSDVRPLTLDPDTLDFINALLDELLVEIIYGARSINPEHLKRLGVTTVLVAEGLPGEPTSLGGLGRAAVNEAEISLHSWYEAQPDMHKGVSGFPPHGSGRGLVAAQEAAKIAFPIIEAVELMRQQVGSLSLLAPETSSKASDWNRICDAWKAAGGDIADETITPAGWWLTTVLSHVCEHILSKLSQVAARDSSATSASVHDLYTTLCEDENLYSFFKRMRIKEDLDKLDRSARRSKQSSRIRPQKSSSKTASSRASSMDSPHGSQPSLISNSREELHSRQPSVSSNGTGRPASEQIYKGFRGVVKVVPTAHKRASSSAFTSVTRFSEEPESTNGRASSAADRAEVDFEAALRSNETVRKSLTPSRFSTIETSPQKPPSAMRRYSDHLSAPTSSESSLVSSSTQASTADSGTVSKRAVAGRSWSSGNKLQPRGPTIEEGDEDDFTSSVMELLKTGPNTESSEGLAAATSKTPPQVSLPPGQQPDAPRSVSPLPDTPPLDDLRPSPRSDASPQLDVPESPRNAASDDAHEHKTGRSATYKATRHRSEQLEGRREVRDLADFLSNTGPTPPPVTNNHVHEESSVSHTSTQSRMSFKGLMSRMTSSKKNKEEEPGNLRARANRRDLLAAPVVTRKKSSNDSGSSGSGQLRTQRSISSVNTSSTLQPQVQSSQSLSTPTSEIADPIPKTREVVRKPSLVRKWAAQVAAGEPTRTSSRRKATTPMTISSPLPTVSLDDEQPAAVVAEPSPRLSSVMEPSSPRDTRERESFYSSIDQDFGPEPAGAGTPEAAFAALTAGSRSGKSSPAIRETDRDRDRDRLERPISSISTRSSPRVGVGLLRHERVHELAEEASVRSVRGNGSARPTSVSASIRSTEPPSSSASPKTSPAALPPRSTSVNASPRSEHRSLVNASPRSEARSLPVVNGVNNSPRSENRSLSRSSMTSEGSIPVSDLLPLRHLLDHATSARECQLLLDAILSQLGVPSTGDIAGPEDRVAAWLLAGREGPNTQPKKSRRKKLSPELAMKTLPALPGSPLAEEEGVEVMTSVEEKERQGEGIGLGIKGYV